MIAALQIVMFWNAENFFDPFDDPLKNDDEFTPNGSRHWTWDRFQVKRDKIAKTIISVSDTFGDIPFVIGFAEIENRLVTSQIANQSPLSEVSDYDYVLRESPDERGIDVGLVYDKTRFKVLRVDSLRAHSLKTRDILYVKGLSLPRCDTLHLFVCHFPSKLGGKGRSQPRRDIVSHLLEHHLDSLKNTLKSPDIVVMGDFNDQNIRLSIPRLETQGGTLKYHGRWETIDHFFVSQNLHHRSSAFIYRPDFLLEPDKTFLGSKPKRTYVGPRYNGGVSDHLPVILKLDLSD